MSAAKDPDVVVEIEIKPNPGVAARPIPAPVRPPRRRTAQYVLWTLFVLLVALFFWLALSSNPYAEAIQAVAGNKHDQAIVDGPFTVSAHNFRYYKFNLPEASTNVAIVGEFSVGADAGRQKNGSKRQSQQVDDGIEVYVLNDAAFAVWQTGYATSSVFESGRVSQGKLEADLPAGAGVYYLVFSNKFASSSSKKVDATIVLHYKNWVPEWIRRIKGELWSAVSG